MSLTLLIFFFLFGTIIGSFLNVVVLRYGARLLGRSRCLSCGRTLRSFELIPIVSFFLQKGRCRGCKSSISLQYPLIELMTGLVFTAVAWKNLQPTTYNLQPDFSLLWWLVVGCQLLVWSLLIAIAVYDFKHKIIPDKLLYGALSAAFLLFSLRLIFGGVTHVWLDALGGFFFAVPFALLWFFSDGRAMGLGDAKLMLLFSWVLGFSKGLSALIVGFWIGATIALFGFLSKTILSLLPHTVFSRHRSWLKNLGPKTELPLGPFLVLGLFIIYFFDIDVTGLGLLLTN